MNEQCKNHLERPKVSVLLPNLNYRRFLEERIQTILDQTFTTWELIVVDSYSDDGAWELIQEFAMRDTRIRISQAPREGIYAALNRCIHLACGEYVYIAMSDDTMNPDCLEKMVTAMDAHPECDICHTCLKIIDEDGNEIDNWWQFESTRFYGELMHQPHIRKAPLDGILHCGLYMIYCSLTQLLIRRSVFDKVGLFPTNRGSIGDFEWNMRIGLTCNVLHLPETLTTWRRHSEQATDSDFLRTAEYQARLCEMIQAALPILRTYHPLFYQKVRVHRLLLPYRQEQFIRGMGERQGWRKKISYALSFLGVSPKSVWDFFLRRFLKKPQRFNNTTYIRQELKQLGIYFEQSIHILT